MKPKERYLNYALLSSANCDQVAFKEDIPIDLSTKRSSPEGPSFGVFKAYHHHHHHVSHGPFPSPPHLNEWAKYCIPSVMAKQYDYPPAIFPYLFINPNCLTGHEIERKQAEAEPLYEQFALPYRLPQDSLLLPVKVDPFTGHHVLHPSHAHHQTHAHHLPHAQHQMDRQSDGDRVPLSTSESCSSSVSSSPYEHFEYNSTQSVELSPEMATRRSCRSLAPPSSAQEVTISPSTNGSQVVARRAKLKKSLSYPNLSCPSAVMLQPRLQPTQPNGYVRRTKSEQNLHLIKSNISPVKTIAPKKLFASNYYQATKDNSKESKENNVKNGNGTPTRFYRNYRKEVIECWDNENRDNRRVHGEDALDLRTKSSVFKLANAVEKAKLKGYCAPVDDCVSEELKQRPVTVPDIYRQYYYYLIQEPAFASRTAVAFAETYAKLLHSNKGEDKSNGHFVKSSPSPGKCVDRGSPYETKRASPDFIVNGSRTELRSADTTNCGLPFDRKRISRPLTGKHVRHGTGASPSTLVSLRNMIQQRQKSKDISTFDTLHRYGKAKANKRVKRK